MNKKIIAAAIAASFIAPAAMAEVTVYGKVRQSVDFVDTNNAGTGATVADEVQINDQVSRLGFKGSEDLGDGMKAVFGMEFGVAISTGANEFSPASPVFSGRNAFVGIAGDFGTVLVGRHDTPLKMSTGKLDVFADTTADYNGNTFGANFSDRRADGTIAYVSPNFSGLTVAGAIVPGENTAGNGDGISDAYSIAAMYDNAGLYLAAAYEAADKETRLLNNTTDDHDQWRLGAGYSMDAFTIGGVYEEETIDLIGGGSVEFDRLMIAGTYTMGNNVIKAAYWEEDNNTTGVSNADRDGWTLGLTHNFSKRTGVDFIYTDADADANAVTFNESTGAIGGAGSATEGDTFSVQLNHAF